MMKIFYIIYYENFDENVDENFDENFDEIIIIAGIDGTYVR